MTKGDLINIVSFGDVREEDKVDKLIHRITREGPFKLKYTVSCSGGKERLMR